MILDVGGVGYLVQCPSSTLSRLAAGAHASLMIEMKVSEDAIKLYGFASAEEREWFRLLQTVQNVGAKVALSVLSTFAARTAAGAGAGRQGDDRPRPRRRPQAGAAHRHRIEGQGARHDAARRGRDAMRRSPGPRGPEADAVTALVKLGYSEGQAAEAVARAANDLGEAAETGALIREALRGMGR